MQKPKTIDELLDCYLADRSNEYSENYTKNARAIAYHLVAVRKGGGQEKRKKSVAGPSARAREEVRPGRGGGGAAAPCRKRIAHLKAAYNFALEVDLIKKSRVPAIKAPPNGPPRERYIDEKSELPALLAAMDATKTLKGPRLRRGEAPPPPRVVGATPLHIILQNELLLRLGCRRGALLALKWDMVDFENRVVRLQDTQTAAERGRKRNKKRRGNQPMDDELYRILSEAKARATCAFVIEWRGKGVKSTYGGQRALYRRAGIEGAHCHDLRRTSSTYVFKESGGDRGKAAEFIVDSRVTADKHYIQDDPAVRLPQVRQVANVLARARPKQSQKDEASLVA